MLNSEWKIFKRIKYGKLLYCKKCRYRRNPWHKFNGVRFSVGYIASNKYCKYHGLFDTPASWPESDLKRYNIILWFTAKKGLLRD